MTTPKPEPDKHDHAGGAHRDGEHRRGRRTGEGERDHPGDLSLREAARIYDVSAATLRKQIRTGQVPAYKARGPWGPEWRVSRRTIDSSGYSVRAVRPGDAGPDGPGGANLRREVALLQKAAAVERNRADQADRELGHAMLECGRLRAALARAHEQPVRCADCAAGAGDTGATAGRPQPGDADLSRATTTPA